MTRTEGRWYVEINTYIIKVMCDGIEICAMFPDRKRNPMDFEQFVANANFIANSANKE